MAAVGDKVFIFEGTYVCEGCINKKCQGCPARYSYTNKAHDVKAIIKYISNSFGRTTFVCTPVLEFGRDDKTKAHSIETHYNDFEVL